MKRTILTLRIIAVLACLTYPGFAVPAHASDFFPLDLWEEMAAGQLTNRVVHEADIEAYRQSIPVNWSKAGVVHTTFPFDVAGELNALGNRHRYDSREYAVSVGSTHRKKANPYWLPEEFSTDMVSGLTAYAQRTPSD